MISRNAEHVIAGYYVERAIKLEFFYYTLSTTQHNASGLPLFNHRYPSRPRSTIEICRSVCVIQRWVHNHNNVLLYVQRLLRSYFQPLDHLRTEEQGRQFRMFSNGYSEIAVRIDGG